MPPSALTRSATRRSDQGLESRTLPDWAELDAFVLLGEPGAGKTCAFELEGERPGCIRISARDFANLTPPPQWASMTLFIDAIDEMRADSLTRDGPIDAIVQRLASLGRPRFRLSCREADWLAAADQPALAAVAASRELHVLHLDPLNEGEILELLGRHADRVPSPALFQKEAAARNLDGLLRNPLLLKLLVDAVGKQWPASRTEVYELACMRMAAEHNAVIQAKTARFAPSLEDTLNDVGLLSAALLLSGADHVELGVNVDALGAVHLQALPAEFSLKNPQQALSTALFSAEGTRRFVRHRTIAEYLAARVLGKLIMRGGLPLSRVLALMTGVDGGVVEPLRGLLAWLAVSCPSERDVVITRDPLACVLYGDVRSFSVTQKGALLRALRREADRFIWFRRGNWAADPFGALGTPEMVPTLRSLMLTNDTSAEHQSLLDCVVDAAQHGAPAPGLREALKILVDNEGLRRDLRVNALDAFLAQSAGDPTQGLQWLDDLASGRLSDEDHELEGLLLWDFYPKHVSPSGVMRHFHVCERTHVVGKYRIFWAAEVVQRTPREQRSELVDGLVKLNLHKKQFAVHYDLPRLVGDLIAAGLEALERPFDLSRVRTWLKLAVDEHEFSALKGPDARGVAAWLERHSDVQKAIVRIGYAETPSDPSSNRIHFWEAESVLHSAQRPRDWYRWQLMQATEALLQHIELAEYCFGEAARRAIDPSADFDITLDDIGRWVEEHRSRYPLVEVWQERCWSLSVTDWRAKEHQQNKQAEAQNAAELARRWRVAEPLMAEIETGTAPPWTLHRLANAYLERYTNIRGDSPLARVQQFLGCDGAQAQRAVDGLVQTLGRSDLPALDEILAADPMNPRLPLAAPCLIGARLRFQADPGVVRTWSDELVRRLVAFHLVQDGDQTPDWYLAVAEARADVVADVLLPFAERSIATRAEYYSSGLGPLGRHDRLARLSERIVPTLLASFPVRARGSQLRRLNSELLPAAYRHIGPATLMTILRERLAAPCLPSVQKMDVASCRVAALASSSFR